MKNMNKMTVRFGDLVAALYDEAKKETKGKKIQSAIVTLALMDLIGPHRRSSHEIARKHHKAA